MASLFTWCESIRLFPWDLVKAKVYQGRAGEPFSLEVEIKTKIKAQQIWNHCKKQWNSLSLDYKQ